MTDTAVHLSVKDIQSLDAARLCYDLGLNQEQVAERVHVSRPTVSKLLAHAHRCGFVRIEVRDPREHDELVISRLTERYDLAEVRLVSVTRAMPGQLGAALGAQAADLLVSLVRDGDAVRRRHTCAGWEPSVEVAHLSDGHTQYSARFQGKGES